MSTHIIAIISNKGGVGKTTTSVSLSTGLARRGYKTLAIDLDPQGSLSEHLGLAPPSDTDITVSECLFDNISLSPKAMLNIEKQTYEPLLTVFQSRRDLAMFDYIMGREQKDNWVEMFNIHMVRIKEGYDYIVIDTPTGFSGLTFSALNACQSYVTPCYPAALDRKGLSELYRGIEEIRRSQNIGVGIGVLFTRVERAKAIKTEIMEIEKEVGKGVFKTKIAKRTKVAEAAKAGKDIYRYDKKVLAGIQYEHFTDEVIEKTRKR